MRIAIVHIPSGDGARLRELAQAMGRRFESMGHRFETLDPGADAARLAGYDFVVVGTEVTGFGKIPGRVAEFLSQAYGLSGKRSLAFVRKSGFRAEKALSRLMRVMEGEGMRVVWSELVAGTEEAAAVAAQTPVERN